MWHFAFHVDFNFLFHSLTNVSKVNEFCETFCYAKNIKCTRDRTRRKVNGLLCFTSCQFSTNQFHYSLWAVKVIRIALERKCCLYNLL